jgi:hypothetical protein
MKAQFGNFAKRDFLQRFLDTVRISLVGTLIVVTGLFLTFLLSIFALLMAPILVFRFCQLRSKFNRSTNYRYYANEFNCNDDTIEGKYTVQNS